MNTVNWDEIPEDVEAVVTYANVAASHFKVIDGAVCTQGYRGHSFDKTLYPSLAAIGSSYGDRFHLRPTKLEWTIYNNDKPLNELSDEQVGAILRYSIEKGAIEVRDDNGSWHDSLSLVGWHTALAYRAKQKSERELFVEAAKSRFSEECGHSIDQIACIAYMLFDSGKFKLVEETK